ncbi:unnamed protein product [Orchesella dallaii]|uniref:Uncharacterized protein n=1 Tax=Orchesella dallaii TaxID=48710 RepID=A0ABP1RCE1_9HEXA
MKLEISKVRVEIVLKKMWSKPMCCLRLRSGLKFIAFVDLVLATALLLISGGAFFYYENNYQDAVTFMNNPPPMVDMFISLRKIEGTTIRVLLSFCLFYYLQKVALGFILFFAAVKESKFMLRLWVLYTLVLLILHILVFLSTLCMGLVEPYAIPIYVAGFLLREYSLWCTSSYLQRLQYCLTDDDSDDGDDRYSYKL